MQVDQMDHGVTWPTYKKTWQWSARSGLHKYWSPCISLKYITRRNRTLKVRVQLCQSSLFLESHLKLDSSLYTTHCYPELPSGVSPRHLTLPIQIPYLSSRPNRISVLGTSSCIRLQQCFEKTVARISVLSDYTFWQAKLQVNLFACSFSFSLSHEHWTRDKIPVCELHNTPTADKATPLTTPHVIVVCLRPRRCLASRVSNRSILWWNNRRN